MTFAIASTAIASSEHAGKLVLPGACSTHGLDSSAIHAMYDLSHLAGRLAQNSSTWMSRESATPLALEFF